MKDRQLRDGGDAGRRGGAARCASHPGALSPRGPVTPQTTVASWPRLAPTRIFTDVFGFPPDCTV